MNTQTSIRESLNYGPYLSTGLEYLMSVLDKPRFEIQQLCYLIEVAAAGPKGASMTDLMNSLNVAHSFVSRNTKLFSAQTRADAVVDYKIDYANPKYRNVTMTEHGLSVLINMLLLINGLATFNHKNAKVTMSAEGKSTAQELMTAWKNA